MVHATVWLCTELMPSRWNFALQWVSVIGWTTFTLLNPGCKYSISVGSLEQVRQSTQQQHSNNIPLVMMNVNHILGKEGVNWDLKAPTRTLLPNPLQPLQLDPIDNRCCPCNLWVVWQRCDYRQKEHTLYFTIVRKAVRKAVRKRVITCLHHKR